VALLQLTAEQQAIVHHPGGHARVSAVAGSGKTTTMVARVGHLLARGVAAGEILVLMFNRSARDAFAETMGRQLAGAGALPEVRTFHSLGMRLVNSFTRRGALPGYRLVTEEYVAEKLARQTANQVWRAEGEEEGWLANEDIEAFILFIDRVKATLDDAAEVFRQLDIAPRYRYFIEAYRLFERVRREQGIRFYADLIHEPLQAMAADGSLAAWVANRVSQVIVDEYQDINEAQQQLLKIVAGSRAEVMVVGDVDQCIYEWRGARPEYITDRFQGDFAKPRNYLLSWTFRYGHQLSLAANHLIAHNRLRDRKLCISHPANRATELRCLSEPAEGRHPVLAVLQRWREEGRRVDEAAVLVRLFAQSVPVELALLEAGIPYRLVGNQPVFACAEILALTGYLQLAAFGRPLAEEGRELLPAMLAQPHLGLKREELQALAEELAAAPAEAPGLLRRRGGGDLPPFLRKRLVEAAENWQAIARLGGEGPAGKTLEGIVDRLGLYEFYRNFAANAALAENRVKTCQALIDFAAGHRLSVVGLLDKLKEFRTAGQEPLGESLLLTSVHRAKGLEWPLVIVPGLEEGSFPFYRERSGGSGDLEDERRLFYVAITRAMERLVCIHPADPKLDQAIALGSGSAPKEPSRASRFLFETNPGLSAGLGRQLDAETPAAADAGPLAAVEIAVAREYLQAIKTEVPLQLTPAARAPAAERPQRLLEFAEIVPGMRISHPRFGAGTVSAIRDRRQGRLAVLFDDHGEVILLARFAKLYVLY
jgi:DNA helicase II / ATP-dependent DNA helicase PcrA